MESHNSKSCTNQKHKYRKYIPQQGQTDSLNQPGTSASVTSSVSAGKISQLQITKRRPLMLRYPPGITIIPLPEVPQSDKPVAESESEEEQEVTVTAFTLKKVATKRSSTDAEATTTGNFRKDVRIRQLLNSSPRLPIKGFDTLALTTKLIFPSTSYSTASASCSSSATADQRSNAGSSGGEAINVQLSQPISRADSCIPLKKRRNLDMATVTNDNNVVIIDINEQLPVSSTEGIKSSTVKMGKGQPRPQRMKLNGRQNGSPPKSTKPCKASSSRKDLNNASRTANLKSKKDAEAANEAFKLLEVKTNANKETTILEQMIEDIFDENREKTTQETTIQIVVDENAPAEDIASAESSGMSSSSNSSCSSSRPNSANDSSQGPSNQNESYIHKERNMSIPCNVLGRGVWVESRYQCDLCGWCSVTHWEMDCHRYQHPYELISYVEILSPYLEDPNSPKRFHCDFIPSVIQVMQKGELQMKVSCVPRPRHAPEKPIVYTNVFSPLRGKNFGVPSYGSQNGVGQTATTSRGQSHPNISSNNLQAMNMNQLDLQQMNIQQQHRNEMFNLQQQHYHQIRMQQQEQQMNLQQQKKINMARQQHLQQQKMLHSQTSDTPLMAAQLAALKTYVCELCLRVEETLEDMNRHRRLHIGVEVTFLEFNSNAKLPIRFLCEPLPKPPGNDKQPVAAAGSMDCTDKA